ncbi:MAG: metallophosphoesterase family protein, partial [Armatimonadota bacterium]
YRTEVPAHAVDVVVGKPTASGVVVSVRSDSDRTGRIVYGRSPDKLDRRSDDRKFAKDTVEFVPIEGFAPGTTVHWKWVADGIETPLRSFTTLRKPGSTFTFAIQADSHLDMGSDSKVYLRSLAEAAKTDFLVDLGDTFMVDKYKTYTDSHPQYLAQRWYWDEFGKPVLAVNGNHDGEQGRYRNTPGDNMADWSRKERTSHFPSQEKHYWAAQSGDALLIGLDPFWYTTDRPARGNETVDNWTMTLGKEQYEWLRRTLEGSKARWKFVFLHNLVGGRGRDNRGGAEVAHLWEWVGKDPDGSDLFSTKRPGWESPIHDLLRKHGVAAVFLGHAHLYVKQEKDGIVYQTVPQPSHGGVGASRSADEYGYTTGTILHGSGGLIVTVAPNKAEVVFQRTDRGETPVETHRYTIGEGAK